ncbi:MAG TPA: hypothetical protein VHO95_03625, partial [Candidatus Dormibacteraeota bacterium]|nr:hypothetical protein [Candidatus Dormibacteraeota bacterium]
AASLAQPATTRLHSAARNVVLEPPVTPTVRVAPPATPVVVQPRTEVMPAPTGAAPRSRRRLYRGAAIGAVAALVLVLLLGLCQVVGATTLNVSPSVVAPGQDVSVSSTNVPANQTGTVELHSLVRSYPFRADSQGRVNTFITVPSDIDLGAHTLSICWSGSCHASTTLRVVSGAAPSGNPSPSPSPTRTTTPVSTPTPPSSAPLTSPPTPTPTVNPCPAESPVLTSPPATVAASSTVTVSGQGFTPGKQVTVTLSGAVTGSKTTTLSSSGTFTVSFTVSLLATGNATATATDACGRTASRNFTIVAGL